MGAQVHLLSIHRHPAEDLADIDPALGAVQATGVWEQVVDLPIDHQAAGRQPTAVVFIRQPGRLVDDDVFCCDGHV
ncbi:hypothetical protein D3C75_795380 [compost metagenome]